MPIEVIRGKQPRPRRVLLYGPPGVGKTTWASKAPDPLFVDIEGGCNDLDVARTKQIVEWQKLGSTLRELLTDGGPYKTIVLDSIDWAEKLLHQQLCREGGVQDHELVKVNGGYGAGYTMAAARISSLLKMFDAIQAKHGWTVVMLGHAKSQRIDDPERQSYTQWQLDLHDKAAAVVREWCDEMFFATTDIAIQEVDAKGKDAGRAIAKGGKKRWIRAVGSPAVAAKNRLGITTDLPLEWSAYQKFWPGSGYTPPPAEPEPEPDSDKPAQLKTEAEAETF
jgi:AAA domain